MKNNEVFKEIIKKTKAMDVNSREFENTLPDFLGKVHTDKDFLKDINSFINNEKNDDSAYRIFFFAQFVFRRYKDVTEMGELIDKYKIRFSKFDTFDFLNVMYSNARGYQSFSIIEFNLRQLKKVIEKTNRKNIGVMHAFATTFCEAFETFENKGQALKKQYLSEVEEMISLVLEGDPDYPKFHSTHARVLLISGKIEYAKTKIKKAIDLEDSSKKDYSLRIGGYQRIFSMIEYKKGMKKFEDQTKEFKSKMDNVNKINISILSIFISVAGFVSAGVAIAQNYSASNASRLIVVTFVSSVILLLSTLLTFTSGWKNKVTSIVMLSLCVIALIILLVLPW